MSYLPGKVLDYEPNFHCTSGQHHPHNVYCPEPDECCENYAPLGLYCCIDGEKWPCSTKQEHVAARTKVTTETSVPSGQQEGTP